MDSQTYDFLLNLHQCFDCFILSKIDQILIDQSHQENLGKCWWPTGIYHCPKCDYWAISETDLQHICNQTS